MKVPDNGEVAPVARPQIGQEWLMMAAAQMHTEHALSERASFWKDFKQVSDDERWAEDVRSEAGLDKDRPVEKEAIPGERIADPRGLGRDVRID